MLFKMQLCASHELAFFFFACWIHWDIYGLSQKIYDRSPVISRLHGAPVVICEDCCLEYDFIIQFLIDIHGWKKEYAREVAD